LPDLAFLPQAHTGSATRSGLTRPESDKQAKPTGGIIVIYEYKVVPAPKKGKRGKGLHGGEEKFANALMQIMNQLGAEGWEYLRSDTLPVEVRSGLRSKSTEFQNMLVFQRVIEDETTVEVPIEASVEVTEIAKTHAPLLPSAPESQAVPELVSLDDRLEIEAPKLAAQ